MCVRRRAQVRAAENRFVVVAASALGVGDALREDLFWPDDTIGHVAIRTRERRIAEAAVWDDASGAEKGT